MASTTLARTLTIGILLSCAAFGAYGTFGAGIKNGLFESLQSSTGDQAEGKHFLCGPSPHKTTYTGIRVIDDQLFVLNSFFVLIIDGRKTWDVTFVYWCLMAEVCAAWVFISIEGHRGANQRGRLVNWTGAFGVLMQNITFTVTTPIYFIIHLLTSPASSSNATHDDILVDPRDAKLLPISTYLSFILPAAQMSLPSPAVLSAGAHYTWLSIWQVFPIAHTCYRLLGRAAHGVLGGAAPPADDPLVTHVMACASVLRAQRFILHLCTIPRTLAIIVALTPAAIAPQALRPVFEQVTLTSLLVPYWPWDSPAAGDPASCAGKAELAKLFLQWDVACGGLAILAWAGFVYLVTVPKIFLRNVVPEVLTYGVLGGPVAVATVLVMQRDGFVLARSIRGKKQ